MNKAELRKVYKNIRAKIAPNDAGEKLRELFLAQTSLKPNSIIASYYPIHTEVDVSLLNLALIECGHQVCLPCKDNNFRSWQPNTPMLAGKFPEPINAPIIDISEIDIFLVPMLAFDADKNRLGYGAGYYDNVLAGVNASKIGIAYEAQLAQKIPTEKHDIKLDMIVTEVKIHE